MREPLAAPKVVVCVEVAGVWCLSDFLTRSFTPPFSAATTPIAWVVSLALIPHNFHGFGNCFWSELLRQSLFQENCSTALLLLKHCFPRTRLSIFSRSKTHLISNLALVLAAVDIAQVQRVAGELHTVGALDQGSAVALGDGPGEVVRDSGGHFGEGLLRVALRD